MIPGGPELLIILGICVLLFGANKLPKLARSMGEATVEFDKGRDAIDEELAQLNDHDDHDDRETEYNQ